jgi:hypothetical protein
MAFLEQNRNTSLCYCVPIVSLVHTMADYRYTGKYRLPRLISEIYNPAFESAFSHGPCWKVNLSSARLLFRICLAIAKC